MTQSQVDIARIKADLEKISARLTEIENLRKKGSPKDFNLLSNNQLYNKFIKRRFLKKSASYLEKNLM